MRSARTYYWAALALAILALATCGRTSLHAQSQAGSEAIAKAIEPVVNDALANFAKCVVTLVKEAGVSSEKAQESCKDVSKRATRTAEGMANSAQKGARNASAVHSCSIWAGCQVPYGNYNGGDYLGGAFRNYPR